MAEAKTYGLWRGKRAFMWHGHVHIMVGGHGSWVKVTGHTDEFHPFTEADLRDPKYRQDLRKVGGEYVSAYATRIS